MKNSGEKSLKLSSLPLAPKLYAAAYIGMGATLCVLLSYIWSNRLDYSFGYLVPMFALYIIYDRSGKIANYFSTPPAGGEKSSKLAAVFCDLFFGAMMLFGLFGYVFFAWLFYLSQNRGTPAFVITFCFSFVSLAMAYFASETDVAGRRKNLRERLEFISWFVFPCFIWIVAVPTFGAVEEKISLILLSIVADIVYHLMDFLGYIVTLRGNVIEFPSGSVGVADACSGIRSLTACLFAGSFLAAAMLDKLWKKIALVLLSMVFAFFNNILRALFLSFWAYENGSDSISGFVHDAAGYFVLIMTVLGLLVMVGIFQINPVPKEFREPRQQ